jgi:hypothetical protein
MLNYFLFCFLIFAFVFSKPVAAQIDTIPETAPVTKEDKEKKIKRRKLNKGPRKALIFSALVPGLGQLYNKKYWKAPVIWAGLGVVGYFIYTNQGYYNNYYSTYKDSFDIANPNKTFSPIHMNDGQRVTNVNQLNQGANTYRRYRDLSIIVGAAIYVLNIVDANVDAHLKEFDVSDELSLSVRPLLYANINRQFTTGITLNFTFKK